MREKLLFVKNNCRSYVMNQNLKPRPAVALPRASKFQDVVTMDLKSYSVGINNYILYLVDMFSRLTVGVLIPEKKPSTVGAMIMEKWIATMGRMKTLHSDRGG